MISATDFLNTQEKKPSVLVPSYMPAEFWVMLTTHIMVKYTPIITACRDHRMKVAGTSRTHTGYSVYVVWYISKVKKKKKKSWVIGSYRD